MIKGLDESILAHNLQARVFLDIGFAQGNTESQDLSFSITSSKNNKIFENSKNHKPILVPFYPF